MCFRKKVIQEEINSKFKKGQTVGYKKEIYLSIGHIYNIKKDNDGNILYDIQIGGECPAIIYDIKEDKVVDISKTK